VALRSNPNGAALRVQLAQAVRDLEVATAAMQFLEVVGFVAPPPPHGILDS
jgi:hypothetical protein